MKQIILTMSAFIFVVHWNACKPSNAAIDLDTGEEISVIKDTATGVMLNAETRQPVRLYVEKKSKDTIYGMTGEVVNNQLIRTESGHYFFAEGEYKIKVEDNDVKIKGEDYKAKYEDDEYKIKSGDDKIKVEDDGDVTIKKGNTKVKIDGESGERKVKYDD